MSSDKPALDLEPIKAREEKATPGPWKSLGRSGRIIVDSNINLGGAIVGVAMCEVQVSRIEDAEFIAHARQDVPDLYREVERLRGELARGWRCFDCDEAFSSCDEAREHFVYAHVVG